MLLSHMLTTQLTTRTAGACSAPIPLPVGGSPTRHLPRHRPVTWACFSGASRE